MTQTERRAASLPMVKYTIVALLISSIGFAGELTPDLILGDWDPGSRAFEGYGVITITQDSISWGACSPVPYAMLENRQMDVYPGNMKGEAPIAGDRWTVITIKVLPADPYGLCFLDHPYIQFAIASDSPNGTHITFYKSQEQLNKGYFGWGVFSKVEPLNGQGVLEWGRIFRDSKSESDRKEALLKINQVSFPDRQEYNRIGLNDLSPLVREVAVGFLHGDDQKAFVPQLIKAMATDVSSEVRYSAASSLAHFYTDNGTDGTEDANLIVKDIDLVFAALADPITQRPVANILGARYSGDTILPCRMSKKVRQRLIKALQSAAKTASGYALEDLNEALRNTGSCK